MLQVAKAFVVTSMYKEINGEVSVMPYHACLYSWIEVLFILIILEFKGLHNDI